MFLERLEIHGFKSFLDRTEIRFGNGITAIVGPNGCGKTNITDAIRWVLGEQSAKQLRGDSMEDVIFGGSLRRKPVGMAEVTLTLRNEKGMLPTEYSQVEIGRRVFRSGNSDYKMNKSSVRLRDIRDLFYGTGMGSHAYSVIERHMVDHVLSDNTGHRRFLFEEAAGITKYKQRKKEAINKLKATNEDLVRVEDIIGELDRELASLSRQVAKARRAERLKNAIRDTDLRLSYEEHQAKFAKARELGEKLAEETARREEAAATLSTREAALLGEKTSLLEVENELTRSRQRLAEAESRRARAEEEFAVLGERLEGLTRQIADLTEDRGRLESRIEALSARHEELAGRVEELDREAAGAKETMGRDEEELAGIERDLESRRRAAEESQERALGLMHGESERKVEWEGARARVHAVAERHQAARARLTEIESRVTALESEIEKLRTQREESERRRTESEARAREAREEIGRLEASLADATERETERREALTQLRTRVETLEDLKASMEGLEEGVQAILRDRKKTQAQGVVADFLDVEPTHLDAIEALVGPLLGAAVVESETEAGRSLELLRDGKSGRASMAVLGRGAGKQTMRSLKPGEKGIVGWVREGLQAHAGAEGLIEVLVGDAVLVETPEDAERLSASYPGHRFVSRSGVVWHGGVVSGGRPSDADRGLLRRGQELKQLLGEREEVERSFAEASEAKLRCLRERDEKTQEIEGLDADRAEIEKNLKAGETRLESLEEQLAEARREQDERRQENEELGAEETKLSAALSAAEGELSQLSKEAADASRSLGELEESVRGLEARRQEIGARVQRERVQLLEVHNRQSEARADLARVDAELGELRESLQARVRELEQAEERQRSTATERETLETALGERRKEEAELRAAADTAVENARRVREELDSEEKEVAEARLRVNELSEYVHQIEVERLTLRSELDKTLERLRVEYDIDLATYRPEPLEEGVEWDPEAARVELEEARRKIANLGPVNELALEEHTKKKERHDFLVTQREDLREAEKQLLEAIQKINTTASDLFEKTFAEVERNFQETFRTLFQGGECGLRKVGDDPLEAEIEIVARPRGKSLQSILLLSSGERALTAIALLFSIYLVKPSPFCILDEVDAPLDDANVERFISMLKRFSGKTQFIVVTHNKKTMEVAESLYGVTMPEPGVSRLVSVRFDGEDAEGEPAAENGSEAAATNGHSENGHSGNGNASAVGDGDSTEEREPVLVGADPEQQN